MDKKLHITLFGGFKITFEGKVISEVNSLRLQELLAWLLLHREIPQTRQRISFIFWPDSRESQARNNLRNLLHLLRKALPNFEEFILVDHTSLKWNQDSSFVFDVDEFEKAIAAAKRSKDLSVQEKKLTEAVTLYKGQLFPDSYTKWIEDQRDRLKVDYQYALEKLVELSQKKCNYIKGIQYAKMWTKENFFNERAWRHLIRCYALANDRANALQTYKKCASILQKELHVNPSPETQALYEQLISNKIESEEPSSISASPLPDEKLLGNTEDRNSVNNLTGMLPSFLIQLKESSRYLYFFTGLILLVLFLQFFPSPFNSGGDTPKKIAIGVLPFNNLSNDTTNNSLTLGIVDILSNNLAQFNDFRVLSHKSVSFYKNKSSQSQMVEELDLDFLIEGSVQTLDEQVQINIQLIDANTNEYIWTKSYERYLGDVFIIQKELTKDILNKIKNVFGLYDNHGLAIYAASVKPEAIQIYMDAMNDYTGISKIKMFNQSITIDSTFSPAHAHLALEYAFLFASSTIKEEKEYHKQKAQQSIKKALDLNPNSTLVHLPLAMLSTFSFEWDSAEKAFRQAITLNPLNDIAHHEFAQFLMRLGRFDEAIESEKRAIYLVPDSYQYQSGLGEIYLFKREYDNAITEIEKVLEFDNHHYITYWWLAKAFMYKKEFARAFEMYDTYSKLSFSNNNGSSKFANVGAQVYGYTGQRKKTLDLINTYLSNNSPDEMDGFSMFSLSLSYCSINDVENALYWLEKAHEAHAGSLIYMKIEPGFDLIRDDPRFQKIEQQIFGIYNSI